MAAIAKLALAGEQAGLSVEEMIIVKGLMPSLEVCNQSIRHALVRDGSFAIETRPET